MENWYVYGKNADFKAIAAKYGIDQVTARIMVNRDVTEDEMGEYLHPDIKELNDPRSMKDMIRAAELIVSLIREDRRIRIFGDYDADGICSTYILTDGLRQIGADVDYVLPDRVKDGYGLNPQMVEKASADGIEAAITCDNGIAAAPAVDLAKEKGMTVIVTDHHSIPYSEEDSTDAPSAFDTEQGQYDMAADDRVYHLPHADCVVDPHRPDDDYPFPDICGAVVAWKLIKVIYEMYDFLSGKMPDYMKYLPEAAFATVTDIMPLRKENRAIVYLGLKAMADSGNTGLDALIEAAGIDRSHIQAWQIGFILGPCFNASGRIDTAEKAVELLLETDHDRAAKDAEELVELNNERKTMTTKGVEQAFGELEARKTVPRVLVVYMPSLHESLCGLVAGRLKEKYSRPVFVLCMTENGDVKGSGRSIEKYPMYERMVEANEAFVKDHPDKDGVFTKFGGHPMAAGLSMREEDIGWLDDFLNEHCQLEDTDLVEKVMIDVPMPLWYVKEPLIRELSVLEPFGNGNEKPVFAENGLSVVSYRKLGKEQQYRKLGLLSKNTTVDAIYFGDGAAMDAAITEAFGDEELRKAMYGRDNGIRLDIVYYPDINEFRGNVSVQAKIQRYRVRQ